MAAMSYNIGPLACQLLLYGFELNAITVYNSLAFIGRNGGGVLSPLGCGCFRPNACPISCNNVEYAAEPKKNSASSHPLSIHTSPDCGKESDCGLNAASVRLHLPKVI